MLYYTDQTTAAAPLSMLAFGAEHLPPATTVHGCDCSSL